jgi:hypothetical protein
MRVSERDWLILRGRLRAFVSAAALPVLIGSMSSFSAGAREDEDHGERADRSVPERTAAADAVAGADA